MVLGRVRRIHLRKRRIGAVWMSPAEGTSGRKGLRWNSLTHSRKSKDNTMTQVESERESGR